MSRMGRRSFSREFKLKVIERLEAGESGTALALELSVKRNPGTQYPIDAVPLHGGGG